MSNLTNETLTEIMKEVREDVREIKTQTQKTNGRVNSLEVWRGYITGGIAILSFVLGFILYIIQK